MVDEFPKEKVGGFLYMEWTGLMVDSWDVRSAQHRAWIADRVEREDVTGLCCLRGSTVGPERRKEEDARMCDRDVAMTLLCPFGYVQMGGGV